MHCRTTHSRQTTMLAVTRFVVFWLAAAGVAFAQTDFTWSPEEPAAGETVNFTIEDDNAVPLEWNFGGEGCDDQAAVFDCTWTPEHCRHITFQYREAGPKTVRLLTDQGATEKTIQVGDGECCTKEGPPDPAFAISPNPTFVGHEVSFLDRSAGLEPPAKTVELEWYPSEGIEIGETIVFRLTGIDEVREVEWDFGEPGCGDLEAVQLCVPTIIDCLSAAFTYATAGPKTIHAVIDDSFTLTGELTVENSGECESGGGGCSVSITPTLMDFEAAGGNGTVNVTAGPGCEWSTDESAGWISILSGTGGTGNGAVEYLVSTNTGGPRQAQIRIGNRNHTVFQEGAEPDPIDNGPTEWSWSILKDDVEVASSDQPSFSTTFDEAGLYWVELWASNCRGESLATGVLRIEEPASAPGGWLVPSAVHAPGLNDTRWRTDISIHNPGSSAMELVLEFRPENTDNVGAELAQMAVTINPGATALLDDVLTLLPGVVEDPDDARIGSILVTVSSTDGTRQPRISSRTYNLASNGTYGQFVQAVAVPVPAHEHIFLAGLVHNDAYRTNIRFSNTGEQAASPEIRLIDPDGFILDILRDRIVPPHSTFQINGIAEVADIDGPVDSFTVRVTTESDTLLAWASVVDNTTGDPVLYNPIAVDYASADLWMPGLAHLEGANDSQWQSDTTFVNPEDSPLLTVVTYHPSEADAEAHELELDRFSPHVSQRFVDIVGSHILSPETESKGHLVLHGTDQAPPLRPAGRTYNLSDGGGTFGQSLFVYRGTSLIEAGDAGIIPGFAISESDDSGSRTNVGLLNTDTEQWAQVSIVVLDLDGAVAAELEQLWIRPDQLVQFSLASRLDLDGVDLRGSVVVRNLSGGAIAAYASVVDNVTQDPVLIPAIPDAAVE